MGVQSYTYVFQKGHPLRGCARRRDRCSPGAGGARRRRLRHTLRQPGIRQQRLQRIADPVQRPPDALRRHRVGAQEPAGLRRRDAPALRAVQCPGRPLSDRHQAADVLPVPHRCGAGQRGHLQPQRAHGRLFARLLQRLDGLLPQPHGGLPRALRQLARQDLHRAGHRLGGDVLRAVARDVPHPLGRTLHNAAGLLRRLRLLDVPLRRLEAQRECHGQPPAEPLCGLGAG